MSVFKKVTREVSGSQLGIKGKGNNEGNFYFYFSTKTVPSGLLSLALTKKTIPFGAKYQKGGMPFCENEVV